MTALTKASSIPAIAELPEFLGAISAATDVGSALSDGVLRLAEACEAEVCALVRGGAVSVSVGYPRGSIHHHDLRGVALGWNHSVDVPGLGVIRATAVPLDDSNDVLVIARASGELTPGERASARAMGRILVLTVRLLETVERQRQLQDIAERQMADNEALLARQRSHRAMLEANLRVQRLISQRHPLDEILQAITDEAAGLLDADVVGIGMTAAGNAGGRAISAGTDMGRRLVRSMDPSLLVTLGQQAASGELDAPRMMALPLKGGAASPVTVAGAPVCDNGASRGGLFLMRPTVIGAHHQIDTSAVETFAGQASIAITDASTVHELHHAFHDTLTGLANRALFLDRLGHALALAGRRGCATALLFIDLDRFKRVNDSLGHSAGDELLRKVGEVLTDAGRAYDSAARLGGDEFAVLMEDTTAEAAMALANRLRHGIARIVGPVGSRGLSTASIGVAVVDGDEASGDELLRRADIAMYSVKRQGRSGVALYAKPMGESRLDTRSVTESLAGGLERGEFVTHYQPVVCLQPREVVGMEALVRWEHPERGLVPPLEFIPAAEETGLIVELGRVVLNAATRRCQELREAVPAASGLGVSVNLSPRQLEHPDVLDHVSAALADSGLPASALTLEVTESLFLVDAEASGERLQALKALGVKLAIDDFGTGFSSLQYIQNYPFDVLKIDRSFISGLGSAANPGSVVKTMLTLGREMGLDTVAEGIETPVELAQLRALRCTLGQGFLFARPLSSEGIGELLSQGVRLSH
ncbi:MAG: sensor domain-containing phosphodiesterase [Microthrixaceae bacterium]